ncbi:UDP-glucose 4-epimerase Gal10 [Terfezia boudieri ATCC MYA-4762]|uniref:DNA-directed RNA polymerases I, II, and III subunit RPABC3 n=1 Tax=Terfezia boudieri ATCC MYA-4762 TaxID=1051890 RepID=A0A3N4L5Z0_9PEZI|nr:UDP-glucose 4-epimerase Gal10 [Terfezia boudieri ATCC MYA-4762]
MSDSLLLDESLRITSINNAKYDRVSRIFASRDDLTFHLDIHHELFPCFEDDTLQLVLATTLSLDGRKDDEASGWREVVDGEGSLADGFDYVCFGKVYRFEEGGENIKVFASFGGLLMFLEGPHKRLSNLRQDNIYLLLKK